ncbi:hypothetical protein HJC99_06140 [Candidatus Saccharibacteria bacterium]|nr:hypothetical protein [Candidatus Saccharibacteria bacterium]
MNLRPATIADIQVGTILTDVNHGIIAPLWMIQTLRRAVPESPDSYFAGLKIELSSFGGSSYNLWLRVNRITGEVTSPNSEGEEGPFLVIDGATVPDGDDPAGYLYFVRQQLAASGAAL